MEHIGYILFPCWDSKKKQKHYRDKLEKLLKFNEFTHKNLSSVDYQNLEEIWTNLITSINPRSYSTQRNTTEHVHSGTHDIKIEHFPYHIPWGMDIFNKLIQGTTLELNDIDCTAFVNAVQEYIIQVHSFIDSHRLIFNIYAPDSSDEHIIKRNTLLETFLVSPWAPTLYTGTTRMETA